MNKFPYKNTMEWYKTLTGSEDAGECIKAVLPAIASLQARVRKQEYIVDEIPVLSYAAALLSVYHASIGFGMSSLSSFKAGDITVKTNAEDDRKHITEALELAFSEARPYLKSGLIFKSIGGGKA